VKPVIIIVGVLVLFLLGLFVLMIPTFNGLSDCLKQGSENLDLLKQRRITEKWNNRQNCAEIKPLSEKLIACYDDVGEKSLLPEQLAFTLGGLINPNVKNEDKEGIIKRHNSSCSQYPETLISK
jgi:hypothetical protein